MCFLEDARKMVGFQNNDLQDNNEVYKAYGRHKWRKLARVQKHWKQTGRIAENVYIYTLKDNLKNSRKHKNTEAHISLAKSDDVSTHHSASGKLHCIRTEREW